MLSMKEKQEIIIGYYREGKSKREISRDTGISRKTVKKYILSYESERLALESASVEAEAALIADLVSPPVYDVSTRAKRKLTSALIARVTALLAENTVKRSRGQHKQQLKKVDIHEQLVSEGFDIGYTSVCNLVRSLENAHRESFIKQSYGPGDVVEFDWGEVKVFIDGKLRRLQLAVFTSACGNYRFSHLFYKQDLASFQEAHALFFAHVGGVHRQLVYDNMRVAVRRFVGPTEKEATEGLLQLSLYYQFDFRFCNVRRGNEKGHVERSVEYVRRKAFSMTDDFANLAAANVHLLSTCDRLNAQPQTASEGRSAQELLELEKAHLLPVPPRPFECGELRELGVDKYATVTVDTCHYSVPEKYTGQRIRVKVYPQRLIGYADGVQIFVHEKRHGQFEWSFQLDHYLTTLSRKPGALAGSLALKQSEPRIKAIYDAHYTDSPRDFIDLLFYLRDQKKELSEIERTIGQLQTLSTVSITTDKIKTICDRKTASAVNKTVFEHLTNSPTETDPISQASARQLGQLAGLMPDSGTLLRQGAVV